MRGLRYRKSAHNGTCPIQGLRMNVDQALAWVNELRAEVDRLKPRPSFLTGSQIYGKPGPDSDHDVVVLMSEETRARLFHLSGSNGSCYFGNLNIIALVDPRQYDAWKAATKELRERTVTPTRDEAIEAMKAAGVQSTGYCDVLSP